MSSPCGDRGCVNSLGGRNAPKCRRHKVPRKDPARTAWLKVIVRDDIPQDIEIVVSALHFCPDDYKLNMSLAEASEVGKFISRLRASVLPSLNLPASCQQADRQESEVTVPVEDGYVNATQALEASSLGDEDGFHASDTLPSTSLLSVSPTVDLTAASALWCVNCGCLQPRGSPLTEERGTQYCPPKEPKWTQTTLVPSRTAVIAFGILLLVPTRSESISYSKAS